jgi:uncharacterized protein YndB with AHSA1/START domain
MARIRVSIVIDATPDEVWSVVEPIEDHVDWMADAETITFTSELRCGIGTTFDCVTKVGPVRLTDKMTITEWEPAQVMGVRHTGIVTGEGRFTLAPAGPGRTEFRWEEELIFPFWMGGPLRDPVGGRILQAIWRRNLKRLKALVEGAPTG